MASSICGIAGVVRTGKEGTCSVPCEIVWHQHLLIVATTTSPRSTISGYLFSSNCGNSGVSRRPARTSRTMPDRIQTLADRPLAVGRRNVPTGRDRQRSQGATHGFLPRRFGADKAMLFAIWHQHRTSLVMQKQKRNQLHCSLYVCEASLKKVKCTRPSQTREISCRYCPPRQRANALRHSANYFP